MQRSTTRSRLSQSTSPIHIVSSRCIYVNDEQSANKKDIATIFHSPFKNGKKNPNFSNPTFMSSSLFYPQQYVREETKHNVRNDQNQMKRRQLYRQRTKRCLQDSSVLNRTSRCSLSRSQSQKVTNRSIKEKRLEHQLKELISYHENLRKITNTVKKENEYPIYADKDKIQRQQKQRTKNQQDLKDFLKLTNQIKAIKREKDQRQKERQMQAMRSKMAQTKLKNKDKENQSKRNGRILSEILKLQIQTSRQNKKYSRK